jgi:hypothetical protein
MNILPFNMDYSHRIRSKYNIALAIFPVGLMFSSFVPFWLFSKYLAYILDIPTNAPVRNHPKGLLWFVVIMIVFIILMLVLYLVGWLVNAIVMRLVFAWPSNNIRRLLLYSEIPERWLKDNTIIASEDKYLVSGWAETRNKGKWRYIFYRGVLSWGLWMFLFMTTFQYISNKAVPSFLYLLGQAFFWGIAGAIFGYLIWCISEKQYLKKNTKNAG